jgi:hypothetical protein
MIGILYLVDCYRQRRTTSNKTYIMVRADTPGRTHSSTSKRGVRAQTGKGGSRAAAAAAATEESTQMPPLAPLWWDKDEGAYMIQLTVGKGPVELVLDTGSSHVSVKGEGCMWTNCSAGDDACETKQCPCGVDTNGNGRQECTLHYYQPAGEAIKPGERGAGTSTTLVYGSQEDSVKHYLDVVSISRLPLSCSQLMSRTPQTQSDASAARFATVEDAHHIKDVVVHRVYYIKGASSSNLFGLAQPPLSRTHTSDGGVVLLERLYGQDPIVWSMVLRDQGGWWAMGAMPCFNNVTTVPLVDPGAFAQYVTRFYVVDIHSVEAGPTLDSMVAVKGKGVPRYLVIDTGTTYTYTSKLFGEALDKVGYDERAWYFRITLGPDSAPVALTYTPAQMRDPEFPTASVLQCTPGRTLDNFDSIFPRASVMLLGAYMMRNCYWLFDLGNKQVGIQSLTD